MSRSVDNKLVNSLINHAMVSTSGFSAAETDDIGINDIHSYRLAIAKTIMDYKLSTNATALLFQTAMSVKSKDRITKELTNRDAFKSNSVAAELLKFINEKVVMATSDQSDGKISMLKIPESFPEICFFIYVYQHRQCTAFDVCTKPWMASVNLIGVARHINFMATWNLWGVEIQVSKIKKTTKNFKRGFDLQIYNQSMADGIKLSAFGSEFLVKAVGYDVADINMMIKFIHNMTEGLDLSKVSNKMITDASTSSTSTPMITSSKPDKLVFCTVTMFNDLTSGNKTIKDAGHFLTVGSLATSTIQDNHYIGLTEEVEAMTEDEKKAHNKNKSEERKKYVRLNLAEILKESFQEYYKADSMPAKSPNDISIMGMTVSDFQDATNLSLPETNVAAITDKPNQAKIDSVKNSVEAFRKKFSEAETKADEEKKEEKKETGEGSKAPVKTAEEAAKENAATMEDTFASFSTDVYDGKASIARQTFVAFGLSTAESAALPKVLVCEADEAAKITSAMTDADVEEYEKETKSAFKKISGMKEMVDDVKEPLEKTKVAASILKEISNRDARIRVKKTTGKKK